jgi:hypothetical protein
MSKGTQRLTAEELYAALCDERKKGLIGQAEVEAQLNQALLLMCKKAEVLADRIDSLEAQYTDVLGKWEDAVKQWRDTLDIALGKKKPAQPAEGFAELADTQKQIVGLLEQQAEALQAKKTVDFAFGEDGRIVGAEVFSHRRSA